MNRKFYLTLIWLISFSCFSQSNFWTAVESRQTDLVSKMDRTSMPARFQTYHLNFELLKDALLQAPDRNLNQASSLVVSFPTSNGQLQNFKVYKASIMHPDLASRYPQIQSYVGYGVEDKTAMIRFSTTLFGFHAINFSAKTGTSYIDTYSQDLSYYIVYNKKNIVSNRAFGCEVVDEATDENIPVHFSPRNNSEIESSTGIFRTYRMAMACTIEFAAFHVNAAGAGAATTAQKKAVVLSAMVVTMTRVNGIYEKDMALTMVLIPNNDAIIFIDSDNFNNNNASQLINQSQTTIDATIGSFNYDIGHTVSTGGGGLAQLNSPCTSSKARGITGLPAPVGDPFDVDYVAHEIGHQFGATHTFNNSCSGNRSNSTAVEPGSGSTIMAYAGICAPNVQDVSDAHFHAISLAQMDAFVAGFGNCSQNQQNFNEAPVIGFIPSYTIPASTPFILPGNATDADNPESLTYCWEQINNNISTQPPISTSNNGPNFRSLPVSDSPIRYMPNLPTVLSGNTVNEWEVVPSVSRTMNFALVVRDNGQPLGGQTARRNIAITTSTAASPFVVTSQNEQGISWVASETETITWNVSGTTAAPFNTQNVKILLSTDGGQNFDYTLLESTPNDGSEVVTVPSDLSSQFCRIMVQSIGNVFYNVNLSNFSIGLDCEQVVDNNLYFIPDGAGNNQAGDTMIVEVAVESEGNIDDFAVNLSVSHTWIGDLVIDIEHPDGTVRNVWNRNCNNPQRTNLQATFRDNSQAIVCGSPTVGTFNPVESFNVFFGKPKAGIYKLHITDFFNQDTGTVDSWAIDFGCTTLNNASFTENKFSIYPNPNQGSFTVQNDFSLSGPTSLEIYDMSGRLIHRQATDSEAPQIDVVLNKVQVGAYLLLISNGNLKETHQIMIK